MRARDWQTAELFSYMNPEAPVLQDHPMRALKRLMDVAFDCLSPEFTAIYARTGRPLIEPERLMRALLLQALFSVRSERQLMRQIT